MRLKKTLWLFLILLAVPLNAAALMCDVCQKDIDGQYIKTSSGNYCSKKCYHSTIEKCSFCKKPCLRYTIRVQNMVFCSKKCKYNVFKCSVCSKGLEQIYYVENVYGERAYFCLDCRKLPHCYFCAMPSERSDTRRDIHVCRKCQESAVQNPGEVRNIFNRVRRDMGKMFGYDTGHNIILRVVDAGTLNKESGNIYLPSGSRRMALMRYQNREQVRKYPDGRVEKKVIDEKCQIFVLQGVPRAMLYDALAHELTHDHIRHKVGKVRDLANEEGFCELIASLYNIKLGNGFLNKAKEKNPDPVYGGGYRKMRSIYQRSKSFSKTLKYVK